jgi:hypothetical protein
MPFEIEDLTINSGPLNPGLAKQFDIKLPGKWAKIRSLKLVQLTTGKMDVTFEIWEKDNSGYDPMDRSTFYLRIIKRTVIQEVEGGGEYHEIFQPEILYHDRDSSYELHCRILNNGDGTASDFAVVVKCGEVGEPL